MTLLPLYDLAGFRDDGSQPGRHAMRERTRSRSHSPSASSDEDVCPITLCTARELGGDAYLSMTDTGRLYSRSHLRMWLLVDSQRRACTSRLPLFVSPLSRRDMHADAQHLRVPMPLCLRGMGPRDEATRTLGDVAAGAGFALLAVPIVMRLVQATSDGEIVPPLAVLLGAVLVGTCSSFAALGCEYALLRSIFERRRHLLAREQTDL